MSERLYVATRKGLFEWARKGRGFSLRREFFLGSPVSACLRDPRDGALYVALHLGHFGVKLHRSLDDGASWTELSPPSYAGVAADEDKEAPSLKMIWTLEPGGADEPGLVWCGTLPGGLFSTRDKGETWTLNRPLWDDPRRPEWVGGGYDDPGLHSILVDPRDSRRVVVGISTGGVWETTDGGAHWTLQGEGLRAEYMPPERANDRLMQDVHRLAWCAKHPESVWTQHHNGVFRAAKGPEKWRELKPAVSGFGFAVAAHPTERGTAWFAPARKDEYRYPEAGRFVVTRTRDGGRSFETLTEGLPKPPAYDLVYRHGLEVDEDGQTLALGSTSGGLWFSADGGDAWRAAPARLPPINAVRFG
ncbi:MAG: exo-alpha-sialidase [Hyphomicrobiales bacterium]|nr:glycoside hydrolase [Hyphomicrobiales bacterium]MDE2016257.1 exo-alpha-sialidase [Hyphomicrobiales bacterium]